MKHTGKTIASAVVLALLLLVNGAAPAAAQDGDVAERTEQLREAWQSAVTAYQGRQFSEAYGHFERAARLGASLEDPKAKETAQRAEQYLPRVAYAEGVSHLQGDEYQQALRAFEKGLQKDSSYVNNLIGKGQAHQRLDQEEQALEAYTRAKNLGEQVGDSESVRRAKDAIRGYYQPRASALLAKSEPGRSDARQAIDLMDDMQEHVDPDANTYYYLAAAYNILGEHERAIEMIDTGLEMHNGSRTDRARFYFEKGEALRYLGDVAEAKEAYRNAAFGSYKQPAEHFIETL